MRPPNSAILITHGTATLAWHCLHGCGGVAVHVGHEVPHPPQQKEVRGVKGRCLRQKGFAD